MRAWSGIRLNLASYDSILMKELANIISSAQKFAPRRASDAEVILTDLTSIRCHLGWARRAPFCDAVRAFRSSMDATAEGPA